LFFSTVFFPEQGKLEEFTAWNGSMLVSGLSLEPEHYNRTFNFFRSISDVVRFTQLKLFRSWRIAATLSAFLVFVGCAAHKPAPPPPIVYPPTSEMALRELNALPQGPYDRLEIITVAAEEGEQLASANKTARQTAAQKGANALVILREVQYRQKVGKRTLQVRRITYLAIHQR
jgi:hypothetical protein